MVSPFFPLRGDFLLIMLFGNKHRVLSSSLIQSLSFFCVLWGCVFKNTHFSQSILHLSSFHLVWMSILLEVVCILHSLGCASGPSGISENQCLHPCASMLPVGDIIPCCHCISTCNFSHHRLEVSLGPAMLIFSTLGILYFH